jgi:hypothetical protein
MVKIAERQQPRVTADQIAAGLRAYFVIVDKWGLNAEQAMTLLGRPSRATFYKWKKGEVEGVRHSLDLATRLSYVLGIFSALEILYQRPELADRWVAQPNLAFGGESALDRMMGGQITDLAAVRDYLDSVRGGR